MRLASDSSSELALVLRCSVIVHVAGHPRLGPSLPSHCKPVAPCLARSNRVRHSTHTSQFTSAFRFTAFCSHNLTSDDFCFQNPKSSSRVLDLLQSPVAPKPNCGGVRRSRFALARRSPKSSLLLALSSGVEAFGRRWAMGVAPSSVRAQVTAIDGVESGRRDTCSAQHARTTH